MDRFCVDSIEEKIIKLENITTGEIKFIREDLLDFKVQESDILKYVDNHYYMDNDTKKIRENRIKEKLEKLKKLP